LETTLPETTPYRKYPPEVTHPAQLWVLTLTDPRPGVLAQTLTLTLEA